mmetsp:Transcript_45982/g.92736  ORF Transcript_45982/g.92736 Transcript_45982/m.92736 type:complete len:222 (-) Transcript_45982:32-697(-)
MVPGVPESGLQRPLRRQRCRLRTESAGLLVEARGEALRRHGLVRLEDQRRGGRLLQPQDARSQLPVHRHHVLPLQREDDRVRLGDGQGSRSSTEGLGAGRVAAVHPADLLRTQGHLPTATAEPLHEPGVGQDEQPRGGGRAHGLRQRHLQQDPRLLVHRPRNSRPGEGRRGTVQGRHHHRVRLRAACPEGAEADTPAQMRRCPPSSACIGNELSCMTFCAP